jgi:hypothetical protein
LAKGFIELAVDDNVEALQTPSGQLVWLEQADAARFRLNQRSLIFTDTGYSYEGFFSAGAGASPRYPPNRKLAVIHRHVYAKTVDEFSFPISSFTAPKVLKVQKAGFFTPRDANGNSTIVDADSFCTTKDGQRIQITPEFIEPIESSRFLECNFKVPERLRPRGAQFPVQVRLKLRLGGGAVGGSTRDVIAVSLANSEVPTLVYTVLHELGHAWGMVPDASPVPGPSLKYTRRIKDGNHCKAGVPDGQEPWESADPDKSGTCVMFSPSNKHTDLSASRSQWFCPRCIELLKAADIQ